MSGPARERYIKGHTRSRADRSSYLYSDHSLAKELLMEIKSCLEPGAKVLEVGCGGGHAAAALARLGFAVTATDISPVAVEIAGENYPGINFAAADALDLNYPDGSFDAVVAVEFIEHLESPERLMAEAGRLLGPRGMFFIKTPNRLLHDLYYRKTANVSEWHPSVMSAKELAGKLAAAGFEPRFVKMAGLPDYQIKKAADRLGQAGRLASAVLRRAPVGWLPVGLQPSLICVAKRRETPRKIEN